MTTAILDAPTALARPVAAARSPMVVLVGNPNAGKTSLFNALTGSRQKVGNYPGVTVERKAGRLALPDGRSIDLIDLPGTYSLSPRSPDEEVTRKVVMGDQAGERRPDAIVVVVDATNLRNHLRFVLELRRLGLPMLVALNMVDMAERDGTTVDAARLAAILGMPVIATVAVRRRGLGEIAEALVPLLAAAMPLTPVVIPASLPVIPAKAGMTMVMRALTVTPISSSSSARRGRSPMPLPRSAARRGAGRRGSTRSRFTLLPGRSCLRACCSSCSRRCLPGRRPR